MAEKSIEICAIEGFAAMPVKSYAHWAVTHVGIHAELPDSSKQAHRDLSNYVIALERENAELSKRLELQCQVSACLGRQVSDKDRDRIFFRDALKKSADDNASLRKCLQSLVNAYGCENPTRDSPIMKDARAALDQSKHTEAGK